MWKYVSIVILFSSGVFAGTPGGLNVAFYSLDDIAGKYNDLFLPVLTGEADLVCKDSYPYIEWGAVNRPVPGINAAELLKSMKDLSIKKIIRMAMNNYSYKYIDGIDVLIFTNVDGSEMNISFYGLEEKNDRLLKVDLNDEKINDKLNDALCMGLSKIPLRVDSGL
ncbi:hypothetical protein [Aeromonas dhakensis]|uniref:hypothetical protein n=1 Tax=Aeromonas dhakensis TaxID=196024 RepID=UPI0028DA6FF3|nr:hypothetical protein [Aeromonas dhakensis]